MTGGDLQNEPVNTLSRRICASEQVVIVITDSEGLAPDFIAPLLWEFGPRIKNKCEECSLYRGREIA